MEQEKEREKPQERDNELIELTNVQGEFEARLIKGALDDEGIESMIRAGIAQNVLPFTVDGLGVMKIYVHAENLERAQEILKNCIHLDEDEVTYFDRDEVDQDQSEEPRPGE